MQKVDAHILIKHPLRVLPNHNPFFIIRILYIHLSRHPILRQIYRSPPHTILHDVEAGACSIPPLVSSVFWVACLL